MKRNEFSAITAIMTILLTVIFSLAGCSMPQSAGNIQNEAAVNPAASQKNINITAYDDWKVVGIYDYDHDGISDLFWRRSTNNAEVRVWLQNGNGGIKANGEFSMPFQKDKWPTGWKVLGVGDLNSDGIADLLWRRQDDSYEVRLWLMDGVNWIKSDTKLGDYNFEPPQGWNVVGISDFLLDNRSTVAWRAPTGLGDIIIGVSRNTSQGFSIPLIAGWKVIAVGDFDQNGIPDKVWRKADDVGEARIWLSDGNGGQYLDFGVPVPEYSGWIVVGIGDLDGGGIPDIVWRKINDKGNISVSSVESIIKTPDLIISEIDICPTTTSSSWIELYNNTNSIKNLKDYKLRTYSRAKNGDFKGIVTFDLPSVEILPGRYLLIRGKTLDSYNNTDSVVYIIDNENRVPHWSSNGNGVGWGSLEILSNGKTVDFVKFGVSNDNPSTPIDWIGPSLPAVPTGTAALGLSLSRDANLSDTNKADDWTIKQFSTPFGPNDIISEVDNDNDGIPDSSELPASTYAGVNLYDLGARQGVRDIFIHIDYMDSADPGCIPQKEALDKVYDIFKRKGIIIHFNAGNIFHTQAGTAPELYDLDDKSHKVPFSNGVSFTGTGDVANIYNYKYLNMQPAKKQIFHYLLMGYSMSASGSRSKPGIAETPGNDIILTYGNYGLNKATESDFNKLVNSQADTIMHELGHNLGLQHGGNEAKDYKPNYISIMNYLYSGRKLPTIGDVEGDAYYYYYYYYYTYMNPDPLGKAFGEILTKTRGTIFLDNMPNSINKTTYIIDYSDGSGSPIDENSINEKAGLGRAGSVPVDFNANGIIDETPYAKDVNNDGKLEILTDHNDWAYLKLLSSHAGSDM